jgi:hypothetical protein
MRKYVSIYAAVKYLICLIERQTQSLLGWQQYGNMMQVCSCDSNDYASKCVQNQKEH